MIHESTTPNPNYLEVVHRIHPTVLSGFIVFLLMEGLRMKQNTYKQYFLLFLWMDNKKKTIRNRKCIIEITMYYL